MTEQELVALLEKIQALHDRAGTEGERRAAAAAHERIRNRLEEVRSEAPEEPFWRGPHLEYRLTEFDPWARKLLFALLRRDGFRPYRYLRQHRQTVMVRAPRDFIDDQLWPEYRALWERLKQYLEEATDRIIAAAVHNDTPEAEEMEEMPRLRPM